MSTSPENLANTPKHAARLALICAALMLGFGALLLNAHPGLQSGAAANPALFAQLPANIAVPTVAATAEVDGDGIVLLTLKTANFGFQDLCGPDLAKERGEAHGHAHIYLGGKKLASAKTPIVALGGLTPGAYTLLITLQAPDHRAYVGPQGMITAHTTVRVPDQTAPASPEA